MTVVGAQRADKVPAAFRGAEGAPRTALVAQEGGAIADKLFLSEGTVRNYISTVLSKLDLRDRTNLAIFYYKNL